MLCDKSKIRFFSLFSLLLSMVVITSCFHDHESGSVKRQDSIPGNDFALAVCSDEKEIYAVDFDANDINTLMSKDC